MGFAELPLCDRFRDQFPVARRYVYLNHAAVAPLCRPAALAMQWLAQDCLEHGSFHYDRWLETYDGFRKAAARLINASPAEIAIVKNTSEGIATVALGFVPSKRGRILVFHEEFPANQYCWRKLEEDGAELVWLSIHDPLDKIEQAARGAKLLAISYVNYLSGHRVDVEKIGEICRRHGVFFFLDAIQGLGAIPLDVQAAHVDALAADGHKWLLGPEGCGLLYVRQEWQDRIEPVEFGWTNVAKFTDYSSRDMTLRPDAGRYECGTLNTIGIYGLRAAMDFLLEVGIEGIKDAVLGSAQALALGAVERGWELACPWSDETGSGIVSIRKAGVDSRMVMHELKKAGIIAANRQGWIRLAPHFYVTPDEIGRVLDCLPR